MNHHWQLTMSIVTNLSAMPACLSAYVVSSKIKLEFEDRDAIVTVEGTSEAFVYSPTEPLKDLILNTLQTSSHTGAL